MSDTPKCLRDPLQWAARMARIHDEHVAPLTAFVDKVRADGRPDVPYFDPLDGGVHAECLFVLEAPGPKAVRSGFVSRNNPDETAKNWFEMNLEVGIDRKRTAIWNAVSWYLGTGLVIRAATAANVREAQPYLMKVLAMLPKLRAVALVGRAAGRIRPCLADDYPHLSVVELPHPSPMFVNRLVENRRAVLRWPAACQSASSPICLTALDSLMNVQPSTQRLP